ncbi:MAG: thiamine pyrophosphate-binding protein [Deltaproteobacteria bacterium]|nr:thiamine pyrophosphate-binding protein [Deltaproteobacteria bacterium]
MKLSVRRSPEKVKGGEIVARMLAAEGVDTVFGIIDGSYFGFYSTLGKYGIRIITPRHESSAAHMAGAYAKLTGKLGVCMASNGPGVANMLPGVAVEQAEGNRVLLITSSRREGIVYPDRGGTFQYFPHVPTISAMSKDSCAVPTFDRVAELTRRALRNCFTGRPGVVHLDVPESIMNGNYEVDPTWFREPEQYRQVEPLTPSRNQVRRAVELLSNARHPLIHAGHGVIHARAWDLVRDLAETLQAPMTTSWAARAAVDERSELAVPMVYQGPLAKARNEADVVLVLGSRIGESDFWGKPPYWAPASNQLVIQVDIDPEHLGNIRPAELPVQADVGAFLREVLTEIRSNPGDLRPRKKWVTALNKACKARRKKLDKKIKTEGMPIHSAYVPGVAQEVFGDEAIMVFDGGNTQIWANFFTEVRTPNSIITTPKMGHLGAGVPQAVGCKAAFPDKVVYGILGDGAMGFQMQEIETAVRNNLPVIYIVLCDRQWGMVKINQEFALKPIKTLIKGTLSPEETINTDIGEIEWDVLARSMGAHGERVSDPAGLEGALRRALASGKPAVVHVDVDQVSHLWAPELKTFKDMHLEPAG